MNILAILCITAIIYLIFFRKKKEQFQIPDEKSIAYILDDFVNLHDNLSYTDYILYLVEKRNQFPKLVGKEAYEALMAEKKLRGSLSTEFILKYIHGGLPP
jgi:hypothetical protein